MPFTVGGDYIPQEKPKKPNKPVRIALEKRKNTTVTAVYNLPLSESEMKDFSATCKKKLGCGGSVKEGVVLVQGSKVDAVKSLLQEMGISSK